MPGESATGGEGQHEEGKPCGSRELWLLFSLFQTRATLHSTKLPFNTPHIYTSGSPPQCCNHWQREQEADLALLAPANWYRFTQETLALCGFLQTFWRTRRIFCVKIEGVIWLPHCRLEGGFDFPAVQLLQNKDSSKVLPRVKCPQKGAKAQEE